MSMSTDDNVLSVHNLTKKIGRRTIVDHVSFEIAAGEVFGFLGPNGAGKTTTIRMLVDLIRPTTGTIKICGEDLRNNHQAALQHVGSIVENPELYPFLTGWENLAHFAVMLPDVSEQRINEVVQIVGMDQRIHDKVKSYSLGMRQRLGIAQALLGRPKLLILDEPTNGLDPQGIKEMREFIRRLAATGLCVFVSSHLLSEVQAMCDRVAIISKGKVIAVGAVNELLVQATPEVHWRVNMPHEAMEKMRARGLLPKHSDAGEIANSSELIVSMEPSQIPELNKEMIKAGIDIYAIEVKQLTLESLFLRLTAGEVLE